MQTTSWRYKRGKKPVETRGCCQDNKDGSMRKLVLNSLAIVVGAVFLLQMLVGSTCACGPAGSGEPSQHACCQTSPATGRHAGTCCAGQSETNGAAACAFQPCMCLHVASQPPPRRAALSDSHSDEPHGPAVVVPVSPAPPPGAFTGALQRSATLPLTLLLPHRATSRAPPLL